MTELKHKGWIELDLTDAQLAMFYSNKLDMSEFKVAPMEYIVLPDDNDPYIWDGKKVSKVKRQTIRSRHFGTIKPRNLEQVMAIDMLKRDNTPVKIIGGQAGTGKTFLAINRALEMIEAGTKDKIVFCRNNIEVKSANPIGYLKGTLEEKYEPWEAPWCDALGDKMELDKLKMRGQFESAVINFIRGRSFDNSIIIVDEAQNLDTYTVKLLGTRVGKDTEIWFLYDTEQIDKKDFAKDCGIVNATNQLYKSPMVQFVELQKCERSEIASLFASIKEG